jgi:chromosome partitioning protein
MTGTPLALLAADPTWTDKEVLTAVGSTVAACVAALVGIGKLAFGWMTNSIRSQLRQAKYDLSVLEKSVADLGPLPAVQQKLADYDKVTAKLEQSAKENGALREQVSGLGKEVDGYHAVVAGLTGERDALKKQLVGAEEERAAVQKELTTEQNRIKKAIKKDGMIWSENVLQATHIDFRPLEPEGRRVPIISMLNLKGGVGKTTTTANLASALAHVGYRVLLLDLDLQGSLTGMFLTEREQDDAYKAGRLVGDFLDASFDAEFPNLMDYTRPLPGFPSKSMLVPTTDGQAYAEMNLTVRWFLRQANRDPRFLLRRELQMRKVTSHFDIILIDCPPLINVSCVNALAASDYVIVPVMPSVQSTARVPVLLERLKEFRENINPDLKVMGVFANRTRGAELTIDEQNRLSALEAQCLDAWGEKVPVFETFIRQAVAFRDCEDERRTLGPDDELFASFEALAKEVESRLPTFCHQPLPNSTGVIA